MRLAILFTLYLGGLFGQGGIDPPVLGQIRDATGRHVRVTGVPGAWHATEIDGGEEWLDPEWKVEIENGLTSLVRIGTGEKWLLPNVEPLLRLSAFTPPDIEDPITSPFAFPLTASGDAVELRFRLRNMGSAAIEVNRIYIPAGGAFKVSNAFPIPRVLAPAGFGDIRITFAPPASGSYQTTIRINDQVWTLTGIASVQTDLEQYDGEWLRVPSGSSIDFGSVETGQSTERWFRQTGSPGGTPLISGSGFSVAVFGEGFRITFQPLTAGNHSGALQIGSRSWPLKGSVFAVIPPQPILSAVKQQMDSGSQERISVGFAYPAKALATGALRLEFIPERPELADDPAVAFLPSLSRSAAFVLKQGAQQADFSGAPDVLLQTGGTAGWIVLRVSVGPLNEEWRVRVAPAPVRLSASRASRSDVLAEVVLTGLDNTRTARRLSFRFYRSDGQMASPGEFTVDVAQGFRDYYKANPGASGSFTLRAQFPVSGDASRLEGVEVAIENESGAAQTGRLRF